MQRKQFLHGWDTIPDAVEASDGKLTEHRVRYLIRNRKSKKLESAMLKFGGAWLLNLRLLETALTGESDGESLDEASPNGASSRIQHSQSPAIQK